MVRLESYYRVYRYLFHRRVPVGGCDSSMSCRRPCHLPYVRGRFATPPGEARREIDMLVISSTITAVVLVTFFRVDKCIFFAGKDDIRFLKSDVTLNVQFHLGEF